MVITSVKIKKLNWEIIWEDPKNSREDSFTENDCGDTVFLTKKIYFNSNMDNDLLYETIKHELVHAYLFSYGMGQIKFDEEVVCDFLATYAEDIIDHSKFILKEIEDKTTKKKEVKKNGKKV